MERGSGYTGRQGGQEMEVATFPSSWIPLMHHPSHKFFPQLHHLHKLLSHFSFSNVLIETHLTYDIV